MIFEIQKLVFTTSLRNRSANVISKCLLLSVVFEKIKMRFGKC